MLKSRLASLMLVTLASLSTGCSILMWHPTSNVVSLGDVDGDGDLDAIVGNGHTDDTGSPNTVWLNDGTGRFTDSGQRLGPDYKETNTIALGDVDGDGDLDAIFGNETPDSVWLNDGAGRFSAHGNDWRRPSSSGYAVTMAVALGDLDGDGDLDAFVGHCCRGRWVASTGPGTIIAQGYGSSPNVVRLNDGTGRFVDTGQRLGNSDTQAITLGDLDGDGDLDAFEANRADDPEVTAAEPGNKVWLNDGAGRFLDNGQVLGQVSSHAVALGDLDGDGDLDAFVGNEGGDQVWLNDALANFTDSGQRLGDGESRSIVLADVDGDGDLDAFVGGQFDSRIWLNHGKGTFSRGSIFEHGPEHAVTIGDVDGDGAPDIFAIHFSGKYLVWRNDGAGQFNQVNR